MDPQHCKAAAKVVWSDKLANVYQSQVNEALALESKSLPESCPACDTIWVPGLSCTLRTVTNHNKNKKSRSRKQEKLAKYLSECQKHSTFETRRQIKIEYRCQCSHKQVETSLVPNIKRSASKMLQETKSKAQAARERSKKRRDNGLDKSNLMASLAAPSLSLNDFLI